MEQFSLEKYLENSSRKVVTRDGREVSIERTDLRGHFPILAIISNNSEDYDIPMAYNNKGKNIDTECEGIADLFFADEEEEPASEDLEEEIENYIKDSLAIKFPTTDKEQIKADIRYIAHHFAEWQKKKDQETIELAEDHAMLAGMNKMKEEMMKDAIESIVEDWCGDSPEITIPLNPQDFKTGDKAKIIIVKEEQ